MNNNSLLKKSFLKFYLILFVLSIPFWIFGVLSGHLANRLPINLPVSALMFICPLVTTLILVHREDKHNGIRKLLNRVFDYKRIEKRIWLLPCIFLMPVAMISSYVVMYLMERPLPEPFIPVLAIPIFIILFFVSAFCEEVGWMGYLVEPMLDKWSALKTGIIMGAIWGIWHMIPYLQAQHDLIWVVWQVFTSILNRILIIWIYNNTGKSIFAAIVFHDMINVSVFLFPNYGSHYDPAITGIVLGIITIIVVFLWGSKTLANYRFLSRKKD